MKKIILVVLSVVGLSITAYAQETVNEIKSLGALQYDGENLTVSYSMGGGCATHETRVTVQFVKPAVPGDYFSRNVFEVKVFDVTPTPDYCEAMLYPTHTVNLKDMIKAEAQSKGISAYDVNVVFPPVEVRLR